MYFGAVDKSDVERPGRSSSEDEALPSVQQDLVEKPESVYKVRSLIALESASLEYPGLHDLTVVPARLPDAEPALRRSCRRMSADAACVDAVGLLKSCMDARVLGDVAVG